MRLGARLHCAFLGLARRRGAAGGRPGGRCGAVTRDPAADLRRIAFCLERALDPSDRVKAFRTAAATVDGVARPELQHRADTASLTELPGIGKVTANVITES